MCKTAVSQHLVWVKRPFNPKPRTIPLMLYSHSQYQAEQLEVL
ncbi:hypothetical protein MNBD_CHLOROFLEXI01-4551 [hydrothermal vent metagenome]|uniref:Uncharacterized protein n=1 Tax=hydrothermal vent metagenome TaxID=652676 RepID=A0A3B0VUT2_9ZZZZ